jgi:hypothetical protein
MMRPVWRVLGRPWLACVFGVAFVSAAGAVRADVASDEASAILVFPKIVVDTSAVPQTPRGRVDTLIRISNTAEVISHCIGGANDGKDCSTNPDLCTGGICSKGGPVSVRCFMVNANGHCVNSPTTICNPSQYNVDGNTCGTGGCKAGWQETDFDINITAQQPIAWLASRGETLCDQADTSGLPCLPLGDAHPGPGGQDNTGSQVPPVSEDPFVGELKCIEVDQNGVPVARNDLKGEAEIIQSNAGQLDVEGYNAIGIPAILGSNSNIGDNTLVLGGPGAEYSSCPNILILDHFFDGAPDPISGETVTTELTLVPCSEDFEHQAALSTPVAVQYLVFNEFEQRFSTQRFLTCFDHFKLSNITSPDSDRSIFSAWVMGTLTGQTRIRSVVDLYHPLVSNALLGVAEEFRDGGGSAAFNLHFNGTRPQSDFITLPSN